jgi:hypothetical protein
MLTVFRRIGSVAEPSLRTADLRCLGHLDEATALHRIDEPVDGNIARDERAPAEPFDVVGDRLLLGFLMVMKSMYCAWREPPPPPGSTRPLPSCDAVFRLLASKSRMISSVKSSMTEQLVRDDERAERVEDRELARPRGRRISARAAE